jgi:hypothetical protein
MGQPHRTLLGIKNQEPRSKNQTRTKNQIQNAQGGDFGSWDLELVWFLALGSWFFFLVYFFPMQNR